MKKAVSGLGANLGANQNSIQAQKSAQKDTSQPSSRQLAALVLEGLRARIEEETLPVNIGGGGRSRTADAADMSRVL